MRTGASGTFGAQLKAFREAAGFTQEELAVIAGLSVHAVSALERGDRLRPQFDTVRALSVALDLKVEDRDSLIERARAPRNGTAVEELREVALPSPPTSLIGREVELQAVRGWLDDPSTRLITLIGPGGSGKTRLVLELAREIAETGQTRVVFVPLASVHDASFVGPSIAEAFGLSDVSAFDLPRRIRSACNAQPTLLVLDNCEHVLDAAPALAELLSATASLRLLTTSREPLRVRGEREYVVGPLGLHDDVASGPEVLRSPAVQLFVDRVRDVEPSFQLTPSAVPAVVAICRHLDALPLALEIAAPWMKVLAPEDLLRRIERNVLLSSMGRRDLPERQQTMTATVAWSYQLLQPNEQRVFRRLGALPHQFTLAGAAAVVAGRSAADADVMDGVITAIAGLIDKSLLQRADSGSGDRPLYRMLETVRAYAALELAAAGERDEAMDGLARYCVEAAATAGESLVGPGQAEWLHNVRDDLENYRRALTWLFEQGRVHEACDIAWGLLFFWMIRGYAAEGLRWYEQVLDRGSLSPQDEARALVGASLMLYAQGNVARPRAMLTRATVLADQCADRVVSAEAQTLFGHVEHGSGNPVAALEWFARGLEAFRMLKTPWGIGSALSGTAGVRLGMGETAASEQLLNEATTVLREAGPWFLTPVLCYRGVGAVSRGEADLAITLMRESLGYIRVLHDRFSFVHALLPLAAGAMLKGDHEWAARVLGASAAVSSSSGARVAISVIQRLKDRTEQEVRERLGTERWERAWLEGASCSIDALLDDIDAALVSS
jgi:predicted ATPase/DNA-binding XRE family transcriptional regulator